MANNTVADWKTLGGYAFNPRDRYRNVYKQFDSAIEGLAGKPAKPTYYASGYQQRMRDVDQIGFKLMMESRKKFPQTRNIDWGHGMASESAILSMPKKVSVKTNYTSTDRYDYEGILPPSVTYKGLMNNLALQRKLVIPSDLGVDSLFLIGLGSTAIAKSIPDVPTFSLPRFLGELREGLPKVPLKALATERKVRAAGGEYLNYQFGLMPTVSDVQTLIQLLFSPKAKAFIRDNMDKEFRSRKVLDKGQNAVSTDLSGTFEANVANTINFKNVKVRRNRIQSYRIWSSCSFKYYQTMRLQGLIRDMERQVGIGIIPNAEDLWNLLPWSWFVDWFTNLDDVVTSLSYLGRDGLYLQRGYIMGTFNDIITDELKCTANGVPITTVGTVHYERKYRVRASPFGFGLTWKEFNPFQLSILGALGISKLRF